MTIGRKRTGGKRARRESKQRGSAGARRAGRDKTEGVERKPGEIAS